MACLLLTHLHENLNSTCIYLKLVRDNAHRFAYCKQPILCGEKKKITSDFKGKLCHFCILTQTTSKYSTLQCNIYTSPVMQFLSSFIVM